MSSLSTYPVAVHSYFAIKNHAEQKKAFIAGTIEQPMFEYEAFFDYENLKQRESLLQKRLDTITDDKVRIALDRSYAQTQFLLTAASMQTSQPSTAQLALFRKQGGELFGEPSAAVAALIVRSIEAYAASNPTHQQLWEYIEKSCPITADDDVFHLPSREHFLHYQRILKAYAPFLYRTHEEWPQTIDEAIKTALHEIGADNEGWSVHTVASGSGAHVSYSKKHVCIGGQYVPHSFSGMKRVVAHEVYGHVNRHLLATEPFSPLESEGVAILVEQLLMQRFSLKRGYRYLAAAAGWGIFGASMDFRQVYEIIWRAMVIRSGYTERVAKSKAFNECARVFRGGRPDVAGAIFTKDIVYLEGNIKVWQYLANNKLESNEFVDMLTGKKRVEINHGR